MCISNRLFLSHSFRVKEPIYLTEKYKEKKERKKRDYFFLFFLFLNRLQMICFVLIIFHFSFVKLENLDILPNKTFDLFQLDHPHITVLGALTTPEHIHILNEHTNQLYSISSTQAIYLSSKSFLLDLNPLLIAIKLCEIGNHSQAKAIIAGQGLDDDDLTLTAISYVSDFYHIPVLTIASRENLFSDKVEHIDVFS